MRARALIPGKYYQVSWLVKHATQHTTLRIRTVKAKSEEAAIFAVIDEEIANNKEKQS
jgi:hypothetical protein